MDQRGGDAGSGRTDGMPESNGAAIGVDPASVELGPVHQAGKRLRSKGLVQLDDGEIRPTDSCATQCNGCSLEGPDAEQMRVDPADRSADDPRQWSLAEFVEC